MSRTHSPAPPPMPGSNLCPAIRPSVPFWGRPRAQPASWGSGTCRPPPKLRRQARGSPPRCLTSTTASDNGPPRLQPTAVALHLSSTRHETAPATWQDDHAPRPRMNALFLALPRLSFVGLFACAARCVVRGLAASRGSCCLSTSFGYWSSYSAANRARSSL